MVIITLEISCNICGASLTIREEATQNYNPLFIARYQSRSKGWDVRDDDKGNAQDLCPRCRMIVASKEGAA
jgi:hypothetical protein